MGRPFIMHTPPLLRGLGISPKGRGGGGQFFIVRDYEGTPSISGGVAYISIKWNGPCKQSEIEKPAAK